MKNKVLTIVLLFYKTNYNFEVYLRDKKKWVGKPHLKNNQKENCGEIVTTRDEYVVWKYCVHTLKREWIQNVFLLTTMLGHVELKLGILHGGKVAKSTFVETSSNRESGRSDQVFRRGPVLTVLVQWWQISPVQVILTSAWVKVTPASFVIHHILLVLWGVPVQRNGRHFTQTTFFSSWWHICTNLWPCHSVWKQQTCNCTLTHFWLVVSTTNIWVFFHDTYRFLKTKQNLFKTFYKMHNVCYRCYIWNYRWSDMIFTKHSTLVTLCQIKDSWKLSAKFLIWLTFPKIIYSNS